MSHHGSEKPFSETLVEEMRRIELAALREGADQFPGGKLRPDDEGVMTMGVTALDDRVIVAFPKPVYWIGMDGNEAMILAQKLIDAGRAAGLKEVATISIGDGRVSFRNEKGEDDG